MKALLIFTSALITLSLGSVLEVDNKIEEEALRLWKLCEGQSSVSDKPVMANDNTYVYCKPAPQTPERIPVTHEDTTFRPKITNDTIVVFIRPPPVVFDHKVGVTGEGSTGPKTVIYVKPVEHKHNLTVEDKTKGPGGQRPIVYYLKKGHGNPGTGPNPGNPTNPGTGPHPHNQSWTSGSDPNTNNPVPPTSFNPSWNNNANSYQGFQTGYPQESQAQAQETFIAQQNVRAPQYLSSSGYNSFQRRYNK